MSNADVQLSIPPDSLKDIIGTELNLVMRYKAFANRQDSLANLRQKHGSVVPWDRRRTSGCSQHACKHALTWHVSALKVRNIKKKKKKKKKKKNLLLEQNVQASS